MQLNLSMSGVAFCGADTGGFQANASPELFARWVAASCLMPFFRAHTALDTLDHEPWSFGTTVRDSVRTLIGLRYQLLPFLYTLMEEATRSGAPVMRPLVWEFPDDPRLADRADSFLLGSSLLVAPIRERGVHERSVYLPADTWYDLWTGERFHGPTTISVEAGWDRLPLFMRAGSVIPYEAVRQHTGERGDGVLRLLVAPADDAAADTRTDAGGPGTSAAGAARGDLYADRGEGFEFREGRFWRARFSADAEGVGVTTVEGDGPAVSRFERATAVRVGSGLPVSDAEGAPLEPGETRIALL
jgi:alpha-glucosidase